jgi:DNA repair exonuclease SbcCD ATPase subunit
LSYALYGNALTNIKKDNLINKTNTKGMMVTIDFEKEGELYRIERGRKPNIMKFWVGDNEKEITDDAQGDSRETQADIERMLGMSHDMFKHIVALNTYTEPFLALKANDQRTIIEQLLGITLLSEKADRLKEQNKATKDAITQEEFRIKAVGDANKRIEEQIEALKRRQTMWINKHAEDTGKLQTALSELLKIDIDAEIAAHKALAEYKSKKKDITDLSSYISRCEQDEVRETKAIEKLQQEIASLHDHQCHTCGQEFHDERHVQVLEAKQQDLTVAEENLITAANDVAAFTEAATTLGELGLAPVTFYDQEQDAVQHRASVASLQQQLAVKCEEDDPYRDQIAEMQSQGIEEISYDVINTLTNVREHQEFLLKLLTNKDSFIRKRIIDQNLSYLNARLGQYLDRIGLPHTVKFLNDLTVSITELGRDLDFHNLSRGEMNRLILSLSLSFRDVWESLYQPINLLFIDELVDSGMDSSGVENCLSILKKISREGNKSIWLVSHKDELVGRVNNTLKVVKEHGYTSYNTDVDIT